MRSIQEIEKDLKAAGEKVAKFKSIHNEGQGGYTDESEIEALSAELEEVKKATSPLSTKEGIQKEREWAKAQGWTGSDLKEAKSACLARGYSLSALQKAIAKL